MADVNPNVPGQPAKKSGCMGCSWWVVIPTGCLFVSLLVCGGGVLVFPAMFAGILKIATSAVQGSIGYTQMLQRAMSDPRVKEALGDPVTVGTMSNPNFKNDNGHVHIDASVELKGSKATGTLKVVGDSDGAKWTYSKAEVETPSETIDLLKPDEEEKDKDKEKDK